MTRKLGLASEADIQHTSKSTWTSHRLIFFLKMAKTSKITIFNLFL